MSDADCLNEDRLTILVCGDRNYRDFNTIYEVLSDLHRPSDSPNSPLPNSDISVLKSLLHNPLSKYNQTGIETIIHGGCFGVDQLSGDVAKQLQIECRVYRAEWNRYGKSAGPRRNQQMIDQEHPDLVIAFHDDIVGSKGTKDMINQSLTADIPTFLVSKKNLHSDHNRYTVSKVIRLRQYSTNR
jgi:hypothetical protein